MMTTITKKIDGSILYYLEDIEPKREFLLFKSSRFNFKYNISWWCFNDIKERAVSDTKNGDIIEYHNKIYQIEKNNENTITSGILLTHDRHGKIFYDRKIEFYPHNICKVLCHTIDEFTTVWERYRKD